jgi:opacity protein-like surface antigen
MRRLALAVAVTGALQSMGGPGGALAQDRFDPRRQARFMIDANISYNLLAGEAGDSLDGGVGAELAGLYQLASVPLRLGAGAGYSRHNIQDIDASANRFDAFGVLELLLFSDETEMIPYLQARVGWMQISREFEGVSTSISGPELGGIVGVDVPVADNISFDVSGQFSWFSGGDLEIDGVSDPGTSRSGTLFALRAGAFFFF